MTEATSPPLHDNVVFLARFLGTPVQVERLRDGLMAQIAPGEELPSATQIQGLLQ